MKVLVTYMSNTGNTKKIAETIYEEITAEKVIQPIDDVKTTDGYDVTFLGFPIKQMGPDKKTRQYIEKHCTAGKDVILFITHAAPEGNPDLIPMLDKFTDAASNANIIGMFDCQGEMGKAVKRIMSIMPSKQLRHWAKTDCSQGQPDATRIQNARNFSNDIMAKYHKMKDTVSVSSETEEFAGVTR